MSVRNGTAVPAVASSELAAEQRERERGPRRGVRRIARVVGVRTSSVAATARPATKPEAMGEVADLFAAQQRFGRRRVHGDAGVAGC